MQLALATEQNLSRIMELIGQAKAFLKNSGVDQWQNGYPDQACIERDIIGGKGYLCMQQGSIVGYLCIDFDGEPAYENLNGSWLSSEPYVVVHRMTFDQQFRGKGLATQALVLTEELSRARGIRSFKIDTDNDNKIMKHLMQKNGFTYCGTICFDNSEKIAYEKLI
mgnify:CR=1 FL=1